MIQLHSDTLPTRGYAMMSQVIYRTKRYSDNVQVTLTDTKRSTYVVHKGDDMRLRTSDYHKAEALAYRLSYCLQD